MGDTTVASEHIAAHLNQVNIMIFPAFERVGMQWERAVTDLKFLSPSECADSIQAPFTLSIVVFQLLNLFDSARGAQKVRSRWRHGS